MDTLGRHLLVEYHGCDRALLDDPEQLRSIMLDAVSAANATAVAEVFHRFAPQGVSGVVVIEESHMSIHTWPETGYAAVDFYTCGDCFPEAANDVLLEGLRAEASECMLVHRGLSGSARSMRVERHTREPSERPPSPPGRAAAGTEAVGGE